MEEKTITDHMQEMRIGIRAMIGAGIPIAEAAEAFKKTYAQQAIVMCRGNQCQAAKTVQAHRNTLHRIISQKAG